MEIQLNSISKNFHISYHRNRPVLAELNLTIERGSFVVILGESGCGKSTLLGMLAGLLPPSSGSIIANGSIVTGPDPARTLLFQQPSLLPWLTVAENIAFGCKLRGEFINLDKRVDELITMIDLSGFEDAHPPELSVGMAQRVSLARALIAQPEALLLDEPFSSLDTFNKSHLQTGLLSIWEKNRFTTVFVTHDIDEAISMGEKIVFLGDSPSTIKAVYDVDLPYPRDMACKSFFEVRKKIVAMQSATNQQRTGQRRRVEN